MKKIAFLGGGSFGVSLAILLANKGNEVTIYDRDCSVVKEINEERTNERYIKGLHIPENVTAFNELDEALEGVDTVVLALPSHVIRSGARSLKNKINSNIPVVCIAKGIEQDTNKTLVEVIEDEIDNPVVVLSGPSHAEEVAFGIPTTVVTSSRNVKDAEEIQELFMTPEFRVYTNDDLIGVEVGGAVKNIIALACGVCDGLGYGDNTKAALMTRGMTEIVRIGVKLGGRIETFLGLTGMGDLIVTCTSMHSRNRRAGILIGKGKTMEEAATEVGMVVEGITACKAFYTLKEKLDIDMPITDALYKVLFENKDPKEVVSELLCRDRKAENY